MTLLWIIENEDTGVPVTSGGQMVVALTPERAQEHAEEWTNACAHLGGYYRARQLGRQACLDLRVDDFFVLTN